MHNAIPNVFLVTQLNYYLFQKCFTDGDLLQEGTLLSVAKESGLDTEQVKAYINDQSNLQKVFDKAMSWAEKGISGK